MKKVLSLLILLFSVSAFSQQRTVDSLSSDSAVFAADSVATDSVALALADSIIDYAMLYIGHSYRYGSSGPDRFDCSGFTSFIYSRFGYHLGRSSSDQARDGRALPDDLHSLQKGDIVVFSGRRNSGQPGHVGIFISLNDDGTSFSFIHSATHSGVIVSSLSEDYYKRRYLCARRIIPDVKVIPDIKTIPVAVDSSEEFHIIRKGDTLSSIASSHATTVARLCEINEITPRTILQIGRKLRVR